MTEPMAAGRELDALVAEKVMGWEWYTFLRSSYILPPNAEERGIVFGLDSYGWKSGKHGEPDYEACTLTDMRHWVVGSFSTDISAAWEVVEKLAPEFEWILENDVEDGSWSAIIYKWEDTSVVSSPVGRSDADTAPHAICLAALRALSDSHSN